MTDTRFFEVQTSGEGLGRDVNMQYTCIKLLDPTLYVFILASPEPIDGLDIIAETVDINYYAMRVEEEAGERLFSALDPARDHTFMSKVRFDELRPYLRTLPSTMANDLRSELSGHLVELSFEEIITLILRYYK